MVWNEWEQLKAEAGKKLAARTRLDHASAKGHGEQGDLKVSQKDLAAVGDAAFKLFDALGRYGRDAWSSSQTAATDLTAQEFELGSALNTVQERWEKSLTSLLDACAHISNHMDYTKKAHAGHEHYIATTFNSIAALTKGFDEGPKR